MVAIGNSALTIVWNLLSDPEARYQDLGPDFYHSRLGRQRRERDLIRKLQILTGMTVTLQPDQESNPQPDPTRPPSRVRPQGSLPPAKPVYFRVSPRPHVTVLLFPARPVAGPGAGRSSLPGAGLGPPGGVGSVGEPGDGAERGERGGGEQDVVEAAAVPARAAWVTAARAAGGTAAATRVPAPQATAAASRWAAPGGAGSRPGRAGWRW